VWRRSSGGDGGKAGRRRDDYWARTAELPPPVLSATADDFAPHNVNSSGQRRQWAQPQAAAAC
jgi:hypothetical protein